MFLPVPAKAQLAVGCWLFIFPWITADSSQQFTRSTVHSFYVKTSVCGAACPQSHLNVSLWGISSPEEGKTVN